MESPNRAELSRSASAVAGRPANPGRRPGLSKAALGRVKLGAIAVSVVAFFGSLVVVAQASPEAIARMNTVGQLVPPAQTAPVTASPRFRAGAQSGSTAPLDLPQRPPMRNIRPLVRSRGS